MCATACRAHSLREDARKRKQQNLFHHQRRNKQSSNSRVSAARWHVARRPKSMNGLDVSINANGIIETIIFLICIDTQTDANTHAMGTTSQQEWNYFLACTCLFGRQRNCLCASSLAHAAIAIPPSAYMMQISVHTKSMTSVCLCVVLSRAFNGDPSRLSKSKSEKKLNRATF